MLRTKESQLGKFGDQNGYFSRVSFDVGAFFEANMAYNNMVGSLWSNDDKKFILEKNQTFFNLTQAKKINFSYSKRFSFLSTEKCS